MALLPHNGLREVALCMLEGDSNEERKFAEKLQCSLRPVTRRLTLIRRTREGE